MLLILIFYNHKWLYSTCVKWRQVTSVMFNSMWPLRDCQATVCKACPTLCDSMDCNMPGFLSFTIFLTFAQIHVHLSQWCYLTVLSSATHFFFCLQFFPASDLFQWVGSLHQVANWSISFSISSTNEAFLSDQCKEIEENNRMEKTRDLFKKIRDTKGTFHAKMGSIKDRNDMD